MKRPIYARFWRPNRLLWIVCALLVVGSSALFLIDFRARERAEIDDTRRFAQSFAQVLAEHSARTFEAVERSLHAAQAVRIQQNAGILTADGAKRALQGLIIGAPALHGIGWTDQAGNVIAYSSDTSTPSPNIADRPHFQMLRDNPLAGLYVGSLYRSRTRDIWISSAAMRLVDNEGNFSGIVSAPLNLAYFSSTFRAIELGQHDAVAILRKDGTLLFREPFVDPEANRTPASLTAVIDEIRQKTSGTFETISSIDGRPRICAFRSISDLDLTIVVALDRADALAPVYRHFWTFGPLVAIFVLAILIGTWLLARKNNLHMQQTRLLEATLENIHEGLMVIDGNSRIAVCNQKAVALLGVPASLVQGNPPVDVIIDYLAGTGEFKQISDNIRARIKPEISLADEYIYERHRPNGVLLEVRTNPFADGGVVRTYNDVTERRRIENELNRNERQFRLLAEKATDIIARTSLNGVWHYISPSCLAILGYTPAELVCTNMADHVHQDDVAGLLHAFDAIAKGDIRADKKIEYRLRHKDGRYLWLEANPTVVYSDLGIAFEMVDVMRDITDRKSMEAAAAVAKQQAEQAVRAKGEFLASMSHELRTPLNSIIGFSNILLANTNLDAGMRRQLGLIQTASDSLLAIVNDVLDYSEIEEGKLQISLSRFVLSELIETSLAIVKEAAKSKGLDLTAEFEDGDLELLGDHLRLRQILLNFLNNAIKFTREGFVCLSAGVRDRVEGGIRLRFSVSDSGIGISGEKRDMLFQRFSQVDGSIRREFGGSGLGLAICKKLAELMDGDIGFESQIGSGSIFWFEVHFPLAPPAVAGDVAARAVSPRQNEGAHILLVEDIAINSEIATSLLTSRGYKVDAVSDGAEAVEAVQKKPYAVVLMDVQMPGMDGITATGLIRDLPGEVANIPIIAMTANVLPDQIRQLKAIGMDGHIGKPFQLDDLVSVIETCRKSAAASAARVAANRLEETRSLLGSSKFDALGAMLAERLREFIRNARSYDHPSLIAESHKLTAATGFLGFGELSRKFADIEHSTVPGLTQEGMLNEVIDESTATLRKISAG